MKHVSLEYNTDKIFGCEFSGDGPDDDDLYTAPAQSITDSPSQTVPNRESTPQPTPFPVPSDGHYGDSPSNHTLKIILGTVLPTVLIALSWAIGKGCDWMDKNRPGEYQKSKKWLRRVGWAFLVISKFIEFLKNPAAMTKNDPEAVSMMRRSGGTENEVFSISYKNE